MKLTVVRTVACTACVVLSGVDSGAARDGSSIRQHVRETGSFERMIVSTDKQLELADLVGSADLVVEASTAAHRSYLDKTEAHIYTDYTFKVHAVIKDRRPPGLRAGHDVTIRRESGTVTVDGRPATTIENDFPAFDAQERYILFLEQSSQQNVYLVIGGPQGAFRAGENITPLATALPDAAPLLASTREAFLGEVRALLKFME